MALNKAKLASELVGLGPGGGALEKLTIRYKTGKGRRRKVEALFNPTEIHISRTVTYRRKRVAGKGGAAGAGVEADVTDVEGATLSIDLFFDSYEARDDAGSWSRAAGTPLTPVNPFQTGDATDVRAYTDKVVRLALPDPDLHNPPRCQLSWGSFDIFDGVLTSLDQRFTMFLADGTPVRAALACRFSEHTPEPQVRASELHSADVDKRRLVRRGDSLQSIAAEEYNDPGLWRLIAKANGIVNPRDLAPGAVLMIPRLRP